MQEPLLNAAPMRLTLIISSLSLGGAERVLSILANYWAGKGHVVTVVTLGSRSHDWYTLHPDIIRLELDLLSYSKHYGHAIVHNLGRILRLRAGIRGSRPDMVISFMDRTNVLTLLATRGLGIPVIVSERTDPRHHSIGRAWNTLRSWIYRYADAVILQSDSIRAWANEKRLGHLVHVIPNPIDAKITSSPPIEKNRNAKYTVVAMGRLTQSKRFDLLLDAFALCRTANPDWSLLLIGDGVERQRLESRARKLGVEKVTTFTGQVRDPSPLLRGADIFVMTSEYEGFPNALLEAMACGLPAIACDCPSGPRDIIREGVDGFLVRPNDVVGLATAMDQLMKDPNQLRGIGMRAMEVVERFGTDRVMKIWDDILLRILFTSRAQ